MKKKACFPHLNVVLRESRNIRARGPDWRAPVDSCCTGGGDKFPTTSRSHEVRMPAPERARGVCGPPALAASSRSETVLALGQQEKRFPFCTSLATAPRLVCFCSAKDVSRAWHPLTAASCTHPLRLIYVPLRDLGAPAQSGRGGSLFGTCVISGAPSR